MVCFSSHIIELCCPGETIDSDQHKRRQILRIRLSIEKLISGAM